jgi:Tripartite tricarboxylate transporter TctB family
VGGGRPPTTLSPLRGDRRVNGKRAVTDILAGLFFVAFGLAFATASLRYQIGTPLRMGPGYFPLALGGILAFLGLLIVGKGFVSSSGDEEQLGSVPWRALFLIVAALLFFGLTVRGLGVVPATAVTAFLTALASYRTSILAAVAIAVGLTVLCVLVFLVALQLRLPMFGPWLPFSF